ncbi:MAG: DUF362 domain-containing protein [Acidobacteriota bacterium]|nr:DUF362 domain-containing protein [Acidobacteriota bacterium]MDH3786144.1 DUF362 domain-containing protein [Acidobacteriota bacterium]
MPEITTPPPRRRSRVAIEAVDGDVQGAVERALDAVDWTRQIPVGADVSLKVNLGWDLFIPGSITSPMVTEAAIRAIRGRVGKIYVVEADQVLEDIESAFVRSGTKAVCDRTGARWVNMTRAPTVTIDRPDNKVLRRIEIPEILQHTRRITLPVMKTHAKTGLSGAIKNQWGCLPTMRHEYHLVLDDALAELTEIVRPDLSLMDATVALEGNGPKNGHPVIADRILASCDPVALDTVQAVQMGLDPRSVTHLQRCAERGLGNHDLDLIDVLGLDPHDTALKFKPARHNAVSRVETILRGSMMKRLFFNTPIFTGCLLGAKAYYRAWTLFRARRAWDEVRRHPLYGAQWQREWRGLTGGNDK